MTTLDFTETYPYRALENGDVMPLLPVGLRLTGPHRDVSIDFLLLLDTGASGLSWTESTSERQESTSFLVSRNGSGAFLGRAAWHTATE